MITSFFAPKGGGTSKSTSSSSSSSSASSSVAILEAPKRQRDEGEEPRGKRAKLDLSAADELLSYLHDHNDTDNNNAISNGGDEHVPTWRDALRRYTSSPAFERLASFVKTERSKYTVYPPPADVFTALNWTPLADVKVVIVGQDPYHGPNQAHGLSFSVRQGVDIPPSLRNIYKELSNDVKVSNFPNNRGMPRHGYLQKWAQQGVLMLNAVLTVRKGDPNSHKKKAGWEDFTDAVIRAVATQQQQQGDKKPVVFLLWGKPASDKAQNILSVTGKNKHIVIQTSHPSPLGASKTKSPFLGSSCFSRTNEALVNMGHAPIDWNVNDE